MRHWLKNLEDWNISRQIVWGIRLPVWYSLKDNPTLQITYLKSDGRQVLRSSEGVLETNELDEAKAGLQQLQAPIDSQYVISQTSPGPDYLQETDTFDTWFSSGQWPVITLKTTKPKDFERFYPTQVMETAYDILIFWVMRMLMLGIHMTGKVPFEQVYLHGLVRDEKGQKMSKSKGNVINPLDIIEKYGADALRMALVMSTTAGQDSSTGEGKIRGMRNFTNKIWNATRYVLEYTKDINNDKKGEKDEEFRNTLNLTIEKTTDYLKKLKIGQASEFIYYSFWHEFCDRYIEISKKGFISKKLLLGGLRTFLKLLHPFVPYVTEAVWQELRGKKLVKEDLLMLTKWPTVS